MVLTFRLARLRLAVGAAGFAAALLVAAARAEPAATIRDRVFTAEQARRGQVAYTGPCDRCHGYKLDGAMNLAPMLTEASSLK